MTKRMLSFADIQNNFPQTQAIQLVSDANIQKWIQRKTSVSCSELIPAPSEATA